VLKKIKRFASNITVSLLAIFLAIALLDALWFGVIAESWYKKEMANVLRNQFVTWPWVVFYFMYGAVIFVLAVVANRDKRALYAAIDGALLGLASYGAYNLTSYSVIEGITLKIMLIDWGWGTALTGTAALAGWHGFQYRRNS
jgi:uncharacterized membrane protein